MISTVKLLKLLQENARMSLKSDRRKDIPVISGRFCKNRKIWKNDGVIAGYHAMVDPMKLGYHILAFINLDVIPEDKPKFYAYAESVPNVLECSCVTGEYSMLMKVAFQTTMELDIFIGQLQKFWERPVPRSYFPPMWVQEAWMWMWCDFYMR